MTLGEKIRQERLARGLSQRQLCGEQITRNMLSQIENGSARPSMDTLRYLAAKLEKPLVWFLEAESESAYDRGDWQGVLDAGETGFACEFARLHLAQELLQSGREAYALRLLESWNSRETAIERQRLLLLCHFHPEMAQQLPSMDEELLARSRLALASGDGERAAALLDAAQQRTGAVWKLLRGQAEYHRGQWQRAAALLTEGLEADARQAAELLEACYRELGDFQQAYHYACMVRQMEK